jgi:peptide subunit release factor 1 (eRF1)
MDIDHLLELARRTASPAVSVFLPIDQPVAAHPETALRLRALVDEAVRTTAAWWSPEAAELVRAQFEAAAPGIGPGERARGLAVFVTPNDHLVLRLPFPVEEEVIVDSSYATRPLLEGFARRVRHRVVVLDATGARLLEGEGDHVTEVETYGFPVRVLRPAEQDTPHRDRPRHETVRDEDRRVVERAVAAALHDAHTADPRPAILVGEKRRVAALLEVARPSYLAGVVHGDHGSDGPDRIVELTQPVLEQWQLQERAAACARLREAVGTGRAVVTLPEVLAAVAEGRGRELIVEEGFSMPRTWLDGLSPGDEPDPSIDTEDVVDDLIEQVLSTGGMVTFVERSSLDDCGQIGLLLRW